MLTAKMEDLLRKIKSGTFDPADTEALERLSAAEFLSELESEYGYRFQERRLRDKWEVGLARSLHHETAAFSSDGSHFPIILLVPVFRRCLFVSGEGNSITGIALASRLAMRPIWKPFRGLALTTGRGFKLDRAPDGWSIKPVEKRTVKLSEDFLKKRGWRFDSLWQFPITARNKRAGK